MKMRRFRVLSGIALAGWAFAAGSAPSHGALVEYQMGQANPQVEDPVNSIDGGNLTNGGGFGSFIINADPSGGGGYASAPVLQVNPTTTGVATNSTEAFADNAFISFLLTVGSDVEDLDLSSLTFDIAKGGSSERGYGVRVTTPTTTNEILKASTTVTNVRPTFANQSIPLSGVTSLQNLTAGQQVTFQIAVFTPDTGNSMELDHIKIDGDVTLVPEPAVLGILALGSLGLLGTRRRRQL